VSARARQRAHRLDGRRSDDPHAHPHTDPARRSRPPRSANAGARRLTILLVEQRVVELELCDRGYVLEPGPAGG